ncbi:MAG: S46 family peptidase [Bacteroidales bacterium]|nr:S46 family peptidase [Bacteroidales bacterium]
MKRLFLFITTIIIFIIPSQADEGMWLPYLLQLNEKDMQANGMKISAEDIYSINHGSLKDAVVLFGSGCTGEIVSDQGLLLTNHHCGYGRIQAHSTLEHDYLTNGFWAMNKNEELPNPGFTVTLLVSMKDVTREVLEGVKDNMSESERQSIINKNINKIKETAVIGTHYQARITPIYNNNQYLLFINEVFTDIRLVGAPPSNIGKFGGDTDNWMWPRHTGDFSVFRIYTGKDGKPAPYSKDNIPYRPKRHLKISLKDINEGDFTFVFGYPGSTQQFIPSYAVELIKDQTDPIAIDLRTKRLDIIKRYINNDRLTRIQYASKAAGISNGWKKWIGELQGLDRLNTVKNKQNIEAQFLTWIQNDPSRQQKYGTLLDQYKNLYAQLQPVAKENSYFMEAFYSIEIVEFMWKLKSLLTLNPNTPDADKERILKNAANNIKSFFKDYNSKLDKEIFILLANEYFQHSQYTRNKIDVEKTADRIFSRSLFLQQEKLEQLVASGNVKALQKLNNDVLVKFAMPYFDLYIDSVSPQYQALNKQITSLNRIWTQALMEMQPDKQFYPDANLTLRVAYGKVAGFEPQDGVKYKHYTTIEGIMQKENPDIYDYVVEPRLKELYNNKDYGRYANSKGEMPVAFIATNHTTGGNSGSPVLNAYGELIGLNFDRCWEGTMSDIQYDPQVCRNITLDIRYCLFIIDKFAGAGHLIEEMDIVN